MLAEWNARIKGKQIPTTNHMVLCMAIVWSHNGTTIAICHPYYRLIVWSATILHNTNWEMITKFETKNEHILHHVNGHTYAFLAGLSRAMKAYTLTFVSDDAEIYSTGVQWTHSGSRLPCVQWHKFCVFQCPGPRGFAIFTLLYCPEIGTSAVSCAINHYTYRLTGN